MEGVPLFNRIHLQFLAAHMLIPYGKVPRTPVERRVYNQMLMSYMELVALVPEIAC